MGLGLFLIFWFLPIAIILIVAVGLYLLSSLLFGCTYDLHQRGRDQTERKERHDLESRTIELTEEQRRIMERFGVTYENRKFHYEGKSYDRLSDIPLK
jgi:hypothetical protein